MLDEFSINSIDAGLAVMRRTPLRDRTELPSPLSRGTLQRLAEQHLAGQPLKQRKQTFRRATF